MLSKELNNRKIVFREPGGDAFRQQEDWRYWSIKPGGERMEWRWSVLIKWLGERLSRHLKIYYRW